MTSDASNIKILILRYISLYIVSINSLFFSLHVIISPLILRWGNGTSGTSLPKKRQRGSQPSFTLYTSSWSGGAFWKYIFSEFNGKALYKDSITFLTSSTWRSYPRLRISLLCRWREHNTDVFSITGCFIAWDTEKYPNFQEKISFKISRWLYYRQGLWKIYFYRDNISHIASTNYKWQLVQW